MSQTQNPTSKCLAASVFLLFLALLVPHNGHTMNHGGHGDDMMEMKSMMKKTKGMDMMMPMVEMPANMSKKDFPKNSIMMMMTPSGEKAFVPWYLTNSFKSMMRMDDDDMAQGVMMRMDNGEFAFVPWYLAPQFSMTMTKKMDMMRGMEMMEGDDMSYMFVPWYRQ